MPFFEEVAIYPANVKTSSFALISKATTIARHNETGHQEESMFLHHTTIKFLTKKHFNRENFSRQALMDGKKLSFLPHLCLFSSLHTMRRLFLLPLLAMPFLLWAQENTATASASTEERAAPVKCKNLAKVNDIDDLLLQIYSNIDSHCLFEVPGDILEKTWGIPVFDYKTLNYEDLSEIRKKKSDEINTEFHRLSNEKEKILFVDITEEILSVRMSIGAYDSYIRDPYAHYKGPFAQYGGSLAQGKYPKFLPEPTRKLMHKPKSLWAVVTGSDIINGIGDPTEVITQYDYRAFNYYYWLNSKQSADLPLLIFVSDKVPLSYIEFYREAKKYLPVLLDSTEDL